MSYGIDRKAKGTSMGVISCRSREASLIPNYIRINATTECYRSNLGPKGGDAGGVSPGVEKSLRTVQRERDDFTTSTRLAIDPTTTRKSRKRLGKKLTIPPAHRCAPDTPTTTSVL